jgi:UDP-glucuronate 4-epimerase
VVTNKNILITGIAGFIGFSLAMKLKDAGYNITGLDNLNEYYDLTLKHDRLRELGIDVMHAGNDVYNTSKLYPNIRFIKMDLEAQVRLAELMKENEFDIVVHLAAQAGVRYSITNPHAYINSNIVGFVNLLESCRQAGIKQFIYASSSSVYGLSKEVPFTEDQTVDEPISLYAATKKSNELIAHVYSHLFNISTTGLRFFTVYGPWGRPDMSPILFAKAICEGKPINVFNGGDLKRDFTYIDDIVNGIQKVVENCPKILKEPSEQPTSAALKTNSRYRIYNIGHGSPIDLMHFIRLLEKELNKDATLKYLPMQPGDVYETYADTGLMRNIFGHENAISIEEGIKKFVKWFVQYYNKDIN